MTKMQGFETHADISPLLQLSHWGIQLTAPLLLTVNLKRCSISAIILISLLHLACEFRSVHAVLCLLPVGVDLPLQGRLDFQEFGAHGLGIALSSFCLPLLASWRTTNHRVPALPWTCRPDSDRSLLDASPRLLLVTFATHDAPRLAIRRCPLGPVSRTGHPRTDCVLDTGARVAHFVCPTWGSLESRPRPIVTSEALRATL